MRLVQISVPADQREEVLEVFKDHQLGYRMTDASGEQAGQVHVEFVLPADAVEHVLDDLTERGFDRGRYTVSVEAEFVQFDHSDAVQNRWAKSPNRLAPAALRSKAKDLRRNTRAFVWMMILSALVAVAGLLANSPAVVVGSMVIAPIVSPVLTASVGLVRNDRGMVLDSLRFMQALGLGVAVVAATAIAWAARVAGVVPGPLAIEHLDLVAIRLSPSILAIAVGLAAGAAGSFGLATKGDVTIVGVMIAAALIPTAGAVGIGLAWGNLGVAVGALLLLVLSMIAINVGGTAMLWYLNYRPDNVDEGLLSTEDPVQALAVGVTVFLVVITLVAVGIGFAQQSAFERSVNGAIGDVMENETNENFTVTETTIDFDAPFVVEEPTVTITVIRPAGEDGAHLPAAFERAIAERRDRPVTVRVQYVEVVQPPEPADSPVASPSPASRIAPNQVTVPAVAAQSPLPTRRPAAPSARARPHF